MRNISDYIAEDGTLRMKNGDGGDSAMKTAMMFNGLFDPSSSIKPSSLALAISSIFVKPGRLVRCKNDGVPWHANPMCTSRDQTVGWFILFGLYGMKAQLFWLSLKHILRFGFCQNWNNETGGFQIADYLTPDIWGIALRGMRLWFLYPLFLLTDIFTLINSIVLILSKDPDDVGNDQNHLQCLYAESQNYPTPISTLAEFIYFKFRFRTYGSYMSGPDSDDDTGTEANYNGPKSVVCTAGVGTMWWYFRDSTGAPPMYNVWVEKKGFWR